MPDWLPKPLELNGPSVEENYRLLYEIFTRDFVESVPIVDGKIVFFEPATDKQNPIYPLGFTHLVTHDGGNNQRFIDFPRACKLPWVRPIIDHYRCDEVSAFHATQFSKKYGQVDNFYLWLEELDFLVILREVRRGRLDGQMLITAYNTTVQTNRKLARMQERALGK